MATLTAVAQASTFPPRVLVSLTGLVALSIVSVTIYRIADGDRTGLRGAVGLDTTGVDSVVRVDGEEPFGIVIQYVAVLVNNVGTVTEVLSSTQTVNVAARYVISDAINALGASVVVERWPDKKRTRAATTHNINGRLVVVSRPRSAASATIEVRTDTAEDGDNLNALLDSATAGTVQIRQSGDVAGFDSYLAVPDDTENRLWWSAERWWKLDVVETEAWAPDLEARGFTLDDIENAYLGGTLNDIRNDFATLLLIAQAEF